MGDIYDDLMNNRHLQLRAAAVPTRWPEPDIGLWPYRRCAIDSVHINLRFSRMVSLNIRVL